MNKFAENPISYFDSHLVLSRRSLLSAAAAGVAAAALAPMEAWADGPATTQLSRMQYSSLPYSAVTIDSGPLKKQYDYALNLFLNLDEDRILKVYRESAGLPAPGPDMGGWYNSDAFAPGHAFGQWMSALSRFGAAGSAEAKAKVRRLVEGFGETLGKGEPFYKHRFPAYTFDKQVLGLTDAYRYAGVEAARDVLKRTVDVAIRFLPEKALTREEMRARPHKDITYTWDESYTLPENLFLAYRTFGEERYREMAKRYLYDKPYFDKLARGEPAMVGQHAYSHMNALSSAAMAYEVLGTQKYFAAIQNAWEMIQKDQCYASGGWGPDETFIAPGKGKLFESLSTTRHSFETPCGTYATFKLARYLIGFTGDARYADGMERVLYNGILAAKPLRADGSAFYYSDYKAAGHKVYHPDKFPCCSGTYPQAIVDYLANIYLASRDTLLINLYVPSTARWAGPTGWVTIRQETDYPQSGKITIHVNPEKPSAFALRLRIPEWTTEASVTVNGVSIPMKIDRSATLIERAWNPGDVVEMILPQSYRTEPIDRQHTDTVAVMRGPMMYVGLSAPTAPAVIQHVAEEPPAVAAGFSLVPFYEVDGESYTTYFTKQA